MEGWAGWEHDRCQHSPCFRLQVGKSQPGDSRAAAEAGGVGEPAGQLPGCRSPAAPLAHGEGADDERAGTPLHRPEHAERTEAAGPGELGAAYASPRWGRVKEGRVSHPVCEVEDHTPSYLSRKRSAMRVLGDLMAPLPSPPNPAERKLL